MTRRCVGAVAALLALVLPTAATGSAEPLIIQTSFTPSAVKFGDTVVARVDVTADRGSVKPDTVHTVYSLAPLTLLAPPIVHRVARGTATIYSYELRTACLSERCVSATGATRPRLAPVRADAERLDGAHVSIATSWSSLEIVGRVSAADVAKARPPFRVDTSVPPATYRIAPSTLSLLLEIAAALLAVLGLALGMVVLRRRVHAQEPTRVDALTRALALARESRKRPGPDRRSALGLVARLLGPRDRRLARSADDLAWSRPTPTPERVTDLVDEVEQEIRR